MAETEAVMCSLSCLICPVAPVVPVALPLSECPVPHLSAALSAPLPVPTPHTRAGPVASSHSEARFGQANLCCPSAPHQTRLPLSQAAWWGDLGCPMAVALPQHISKQRGSPAKLITHTCLRPSGLSGAPAGTHQAPHCLPPASS